MRTTEGMATRIHPGLQTGGAFARFITWIVLAVMFAGSVAAFIYLDSALTSLNTMPVAASGRFVADANAWWIADVEHVDRLAEKWPATFPTVVGELAILRIHEKRLAAQGVKMTETGLAILPPESSGRLHLIRAAMENRLALLRFRWDLEDGLATVQSYQGHPLALDQAGRAVEVEEVEHLLAQLNLPRSIVEGFRLILLPFVLEETAGLGGPGEAIIGAAPLDSAPLPHRTAYTLLHELGHHVHFTYIDARPLAKTVWREYMDLRGIPSWVESDFAKSDAWARSTQETFAEDFRLLFGPPDARTIPHATVYGDPRLLPDRGEAVRDFILDLIR